jgi:hypothetical protein
MSGDPRFLTGMCRRQPSLRLPGPETRGIVLGGADNAMLRRRFAPRASIIMCSGCEEIRPGDRRE